MTPEGPYVSPWTSRGWYLVSTVQGNKICFSVVQNGLQPHDGTIFPDVRAARTYLKDNGFAMKRVNVVSASV